MKYLTWLITKHFSSCLRNFGTPFHCISCDSFNSVGAVPGGRALVFEAVGSQTGQVLCWVGRLPSTREVREGYQHSIPLRLAEERRRACESVTVWDLDDWSSGFPSGDLLSQDMGTWLVENTCFCLCVRLASLAGFPFLPRGHSKGLEAYADTTQHLRLLLRK